MTEPELIAAAVQAAMQATAEPSVVSSGWVQVAATLFGMFAVGAWTVMKVKTTVAVLDAQLIAQRNDMERLRSFIQEIDSRQRAVERQIAMCTAMQQTGACPTQPTPEVGT